MDQSPLTLQSRPDIFEPKIVQLYKQLFQEVDHDKSEGFWRELLLLKPEISQLATILDDTDPSYLLHNSDITQQLLLQCIAAIEHATASTDENALETLIVFLDRILSKRYQSPSSDIIEILAGLDYVDQVLTDLVIVLDRTIASGRTAILKEKAARVALVVTSGAFHTSLLTYYTHRDLLPALLQLVHDTSTSDGRDVAMILLGILANANKFETQNPYLLRLSSCANAQDLSALTSLTYMMCSKLRDDYVLVQNDAPEPWSVYSTLGYVGLSALARSRSATPTGEHSRQKFEALPTAEAASLLAIYDFTLRNADFRMSLVGDVISPADRPRAICAICSLASYLLQHAHRSARGALYSHLVLIVLQVVVEDANVTKRLCEVKSEARLCRQRPPSLPTVTGTRPIIAVLLDVAVDCVNHNLRTRLDINIYQSSLGLLLRICAHLKRTRTRVAYHWSELWRCLLSFVRFLTAYAESVAEINGIELVVSTLINVIAMCLTQGEGFLPDTGELDDLFYKLAESHAELARLSSLYRLDSSRAGIDIKTLVEASADLATEVEKAGGKLKNIGHREAMKVIRDRYETLSIESREDSDRWTPYREQDNKTEIKKITRIAVADARILAAR